MKKIMQTKTGLGQGNCLAACIASILHLDIEEIPNHGSCHHPELTKYLAGKGYCLTMVKHEPEQHIIYPDYFILTGQSPRHKECNHAVVASIDGIQFDIVHDPHPDSIKNMEILSYEYVVFIGAKV